MGRLKGFTHGCHLLAWIRLEPTALDWLHDPVATPSAYKDRSSAPAARSRRYDRGAVCTLLLIFLQSANQLQPKEQIMSSSTLSSKSACLAMSLAALTNLAAACGDACESTTSFESASVIHRRPIHLPSLDDSDAPASFNSSSYDDVRLGLPSELAAMISSAASIPTAHPSTPDEVRYYPTYSESEYCSSKLSSQIDPWTTAYSSVHDCCSTEFGYDYESCMNPLELPVELSEMSNMPVAAPTVAAPTVGLDELYYSVGEGCASKPVGRFDAWEESYTSKVECCEVTMSWDFDSCVEQS